MHDSKPTVMIKFLEININVNNKQMKKRNNTKKGKKGKANSSKKSNDKKVLKSKGLWNTF